MLKSFALQTVTGILALFGLNREYTAQPQLLKNVNEPPTDVLCLNGELFSTERGSPDVASNSQASPAPTDHPYGVEAVTGAVQARLRANEAAQQAILNGNPDPAVLRAYSGTGGLGAHSESIDQFYTPARIGKLMWNMATINLKLDDPKKPVRALEPSCGNGGLLAQAPEGVLLTGVELDPVAGRAAQLLHPHASVHVMPYELYTTRSSDTLFDVAVLNPPFGVRHSTRDLHEPEEVRAERYFMKHVLKRVKHGGTVVALLPVSVLHGTSHRGWRAEILRQALPIHAVLVPEGAFKAAGAGVTTCLLTLRRHDYGVASGLSVLTEQEMTDVLTAFTADVMHRKLVSGFIDGTGLITSKQNGEHTQHALNFETRAWHLGLQAEITHGRFGQPAFEGPLSVNSEPVMQQLKEALKATPVTLRLTGETVHDQVGEEKAREFRKASEEESLHAIPEGTLSTDRRYCFRLGAWEATDDFSDPCIFQAAQLAQTLQTYLHARTLGRPETPQRRKLALAQHSTYIRSHGSFDRKRLLRLVDKYPLFALLLAHLDNESGLTLPTDEAIKLPIRGVTLPDIAGELADLMALTEESLIEYARVSREDARQHLSEHYAFTGQLWIEPGLYYAGHAFLKADEAKQLAQQFSGYEQEALIRQSQEFLRRVKHVPLAELTLSPRDAVIPIPTLQAWVNEFLNSHHDEKDTLSVTRERGAVKINLRAGAGDELLQARTHVDIRKTQQLELFLNHRTEVERIQGSKEMTDAEYMAARTIAIEEARAYEAEVTRHFQNWLPNSDFALLTEEAYTWARGAVLRAEGSIRPLAVSGYRGKPPHPYQLSDARSMAMTSGMINAYDVGLGKTIEMLLLIGYLKMCGAAARPIVSVPAGLVSNWAVNARECYPDWNIVTVGMSVRKDKDGLTVYKRKADGSYMLKDGQRIEAWVKDSPAVKKAKIASLAGGQVDLIIMSRESLTELGMFRETRQRLIMDDPQYLRNLEVQSTLEDQPRRGRHQELVKQLGVFGAMMSRVNIAREGELAFEVLGCDFLGHDEAHGLKNLFAAPTTFGETPKFLGGGGESKRALDALHKGRFIRSQGGKTYGFTASWVKNSPLEVYSMLSMVTDQLPGYGLPTNEALLDQYIKVEPEIITEMDGSVSVRPCVTGFRRLKELRQIIRNHVVARTYGDPEVITSSGEPLSVPRADVEEVLIDMSDEQAEKYVGLRERARMADANAKGDLHPFSVLWDMRKLTIDPALLNVSGRNPRFEKIAELALENRATGGKAIVFLSVGERQGSFERLKATLVKAGYPEREIAIVSSHTHKSSVDRQDLEDSYNYGDLTLILGTDVVGQGFNLQVGTTLIINADLPWTPEEIRQRVGRGARQGNTAKKLRNVYLLMRGSFDTITYTILSGKQSWLTQLWRDDVDEVSNSGKGFSGEELALLMSDDPDKTRDQIASKKVELAELTGRAALQRHLEILSSALNARDHLLNATERARNRKYGITAHDQARIRLARATFEERRAATLQTDFSLAKLVDYSGALYWFGMIPVHVGMQFDLEDQTYQVAQVSSGTVMAVDRDGHTHAFTNTQLHRARNLLPTSDQTAYQPPETLNVPNLSSLPGFKIHVIDARTSDRLVPRNPEQVVSIAVKGREVSLAHPDDGHGLRHRLLTGHTVMHFLTESDDTGNFIVQAAIVLSTDPGMVNRTRQMQESPDLHARLLQMAAQALGAQVTPQPQAA